MEPSGEPSVILWFRRNLRLSDNPAVTAAVSRPGPVIPVFLDEPNQTKDRALGASSQWWLRRSLETLDTLLREKGSRLVVRRGKAEPELFRLVQETHACAVIWDRSYEPAARKRDAQLASALRKKGVAVETFNTALLVEPGDVVTRAGKPFRVFTPFWRACLRSEQIAEPLLPPKTIPGPKVWPASDLRQRRCPAAPAVDGVLAATWTPGELGAQERLAAFLEGPLAAYAIDRDRPDRAGTSQLSPHLHFGEVSPRQVWHAVQTQVAIASEKGIVAGGEAFPRQLYWREFAHHLLYHEPQTTHEPLRPEFKAFPWRDDSKGLEAWRQGRTGYPYIDAGMRQLASIGWMHNRVRMAVASFLVKDLLIPWQSGAKWFWEKLVDADLPNNAFGWQWVAGCGADAAPFFRVFNPVTQGEKFDPHGAYVRRWVPELAGLPEKWVHKPWQAPEQVLENAGVTLGKTYPAPIVDHREARTRALEAFQGIRGA
ncbi:MAG TPA: deoxyribodipyrimidine photo-lyase [Candidatus Hydrogenedentes bacterium]|nr:deoxyribodipyrimidine photo-lyase [Candidatus Hydrogenedentota bacterium]